MDGPGNAFSEKFFSAHCASSSGKMVAGLRAETKVLCMRRWETSWETCEDPQPPDSVIPYSDSQLDNTRSGAFQGCFKGLKETVLVPAPKINYLGKFTSSF